MFQIGLALVLLAVSGLSLWQAVVAQEGIAFVALLLAALVSFAPVVALAYRAYGLVRAYYVLERDGLRLRWGLRAEDIPLPEVEWVRSAADLPALFEGRGGKKPRLSLPWLHWPGAIIGTRDVDGLGPVEFLASDPGNLVLVATPQRIFAISPVDPGEFMRAFGRLTELGSLTPLKPHSIYPTFILGRAWTDRPARTLLMAGLLLSLALLIWVTLVIPTRTSIPLGFTPEGLPGEPGPIERLLLLPVLAGLTYLVNLIGGLFFYRRSDWQPVAYLLWAASVVETVLLLVAMFILGKT